jgi:hypothetical protein
MPEGLAVGREELDAQALPFTLAAVEIEALEQATTAWRERRLNSFVPLAGGRAARPRLSR